MTVYLLDGTTIPVFRHVLAVLLIGGALYEALPTLSGAAPWARSCAAYGPGHGATTPRRLGAALKRWFVYELLGVLVVGVLNVLWCLFDRPWRQCWHDKLARTFVASG